MPRVEADFAGKGVSHLYARREVLHRCDAFTRHPTKRAEIILVVGWVEKPNARSVLDDPLSLCEGGVGFGDSL